MKQTFFILLLSFLTMNSYGQDFLNLWDIAEIPNSRKSNEKEEIPERDIVFIKHVQSPTLEVFLPSERMANGKGILILPGGGYGGVAYDWEGTDYAKWLNTQGIAAFVLKYRSPQSKSVVTSYEAPIQDAQRAMRYIRHHASKFHVKKDKIGVIGSSAGGHLASTLGTHQKAYYEASDEIDQEEFSPNYMLLIYPVISMQKGTTHMGSRLNLLGQEATEELIQQFSNELHVDENTPMTFIVHSGNDGAVPVENSILFYKALNDKKVKVDMHLFPKGGHGYGMGTASDSTPDWTVLAEQWLLQFDKE